MYEHIQYCQKCQLDSTPIQKIGDDENSDNQLFGENIDTPEP